MLWHRSVPAQTLPAPGPVPDVHALRQLRLQASWQRDRWVARRRVALRWALWFAGRYVLPAALVLAAAMLLWFWLIPHWMAPAALPATSPAAMPASAPVAIWAPTPATAPVQLPEPALEPVLQLRLQSELPAAGTSAPPSKAAAPRADKFPSPKLAPDNWLHSKEP